MVLNSSFEYQSVINLPLPEPREGENDDTIKSKGLEIGVSLLHDANVMIDFDNKTRTHESITPAHEKAIDVHKLASQFGVPLQAADDLKSSSSEWKHYQVWEDIPVMGMSKRITFFTAIRCNQDGMEVLSDPGSSVTMYGKYVLSASETEYRCLKLVEDTQMQCSALLTWYIKSTMIKAHERVNAFYKEKFVEGMRGKTWI